MDKSGRGKIKAGQVVKGYIIYPLIVAAVLLALAIALFFIDTMAALVASGAFIIYCVVTAVFLYVNTRNLMDRLFKFANEYATLEGKVVKDFPLPFVIIGMDGKILTYNHLFGRMCDAPSNTCSILEIFRELKESDLVFDGNSKDVSVIYDERSYRLQFRKLPIERKVISRKLLVFPDDKPLQVLAVYLFDETEIVNMVKKGAEEQLVVGSLYIDNYTETLERFSDVERSLRAALIDRTVSEYFQGVYGVVRKLEKDRYIVLFKKRYLAGFQRSKFDLLDKVKALDANADIPITISMGVGLGDDYPKCAEQARLALELALGRGGDQVVVKDGARMYFYGGKTRQAEKNTRVKARIKALTIREVLMRKDHIVVMGHKTCDIDSFGSAIGVYKAAKALGKKAYIVLNELTNTVRPVLETFLDDPDYAEGVFVSNTEAGAYVDKNTAVVIVDVNRPTLFECPELVNKTDTVLMIDHHIQCGERIPSLVLSYVEPTASSASEMVAEILQYIADGIKLKQNEAEALYAGILIDTNYFSKNTGVRTFEAAAYLKKNGVDVAKVKGLFNDTLEDFKAKAETIKSAEIIEKGFAMAICPAEGIENPTIVAAQVANELLDINSIIGSFVLLDYNNKIYISARSTGEVNVQLVMERMGGGGHMNMAGAQMEGIDMNETIRRLKMTVHKMIEEGDL